MTTTGDHFGRFLDLVASTLDEPDLEPGDLAARAHVSRHHFDRIVAAVSGEPPGTFRRRLLLERAAHRLVDGTGTILDVAVEAGYGSHEAFTRAFARAYGCTPSRARTAPPPSLRLPAPSGVHFHPPGGVLLPATRKVTAMDVLSGMVRHHVWLVGEILDRAQHLDDAVLDAAVELSVDGIDDQPTFRGLLHRLVGQQEMWLAAVEGRGLPDNEPPPDTAMDYVEGRPPRETVAQLRIRYAEVGARFVDLLETVESEGRLGDTFVDAVCDPPRTFTYGGMFAHVLTFGGHRRTLVLGALADAGVTDLGAGDPMDWMAQRV